MVHIWMSHVAHRNESRHHPRTHSAFWHWNETIHEPQHTTPHCNTLQHTATHCSTLRHTAAHCNTLQHTATHCNTLQHSAAQCSTMQHTAIHCNTLQYTATLCITQQRTFWAVEWNSIHALTAAVVLVMIATCGANPRNATSAPTTVPMSNKSWHTY